MDQPSSKPPQQDILAQGLAYSFGKARVLQGIDLQVPKGSIYGFLGANGAGKTTTIRALLGLHRPEAGEVQFFGKPFESHRIETLAQIGTLIEHPSYYGHLSAVENLRITCKLRGLPYTRIPEVLALVGLGDTGKKPTIRFSMGMKQRLGLASALLPNPRLLVLDEPMNGLDPIGISEIRALLIRLNAEHGVTIFYSSHLLAEVERTATHVGIIAGGQMRWQGTLPSLMAMQQPWVDFRINEPTKGLAVAGQLGLTAEQENGSIRLKALTDPHVHSLNQALLQAGLEVYRITQSQYNLEDQFLALIEPSKAPATT